MSKREAWNARYGATDLATDLVWGAAPNRFVEEALRDVAPRGRALDLACGEGRNAIWLAERGWRVTAVDFSSVAIERARKLADQRGADVELLEADVTTWEPEPGAYALVLVTYLQVPPADRRAVWAYVARALAPGGDLLLVGHALRNLEHGTGGPRDPDVLWDPGRVAGELRAAGLTVLSAEEVLRPVDGAESDAIDTRITGRL